MKTNQNLVGWMKSALYSLLLTLGVSLTVNVEAQPEPGPGHKKMKINVGDWVYEGESHGTPFGPAGKIKGKESIRMILDGFFWQSHWEDELQGEITARGTTLLRYDPRTDVYVDYSFANDGSFGCATNTIKGNVWTALGIQTDAKGKGYPTRFVRTFSSDGSDCIMKAEYSADEGRTWMPWWEVNSRKVKQEWSVDEESAWRMVRTYMELEANKKLDELMEYIHDDYLGWFNREPLPTTKSELRQVLEHEYKNQLVLFQQIKPVGMRIKGDFALAHYHWRRTVRNAEGEEEIQRGRWTDILVREGGRWLLIGDHGGPDFATGE